MADRFVWPRRQPVAVGTADRLRPPKGPGELAIPFLMPALRGLGGSRWNRALPGPTPPNAVPWFSS